LICEFGTTEESVDESASEIRICFGKKWCKNGLSQRSALIESGIARTVRPNALKS